jgi:hypothetical protein
MAFIVPQINSVCKMIGDGQLSLPCFSSNLELTNGFQSVGQPATIFGCTNKNDTKVGKNDLGASNPQLVYIMHLFRS